MLVLRVPAHEDAAAPGRGPRRGTTGASPAVPSILGIGDVDVWTSRDAVWASEPPKSLVVLGGGPVGVELSQFFHRLGARVTLVEPSGTLLSRVDRDAGALLRERL